MEGKIYNHDLSDGINLPRTRQTIYTKVAGDLIPVSPTYATCCLDDMKTRQTDRNQTEDAYVNSASFTQNDCNFDYVNNNIHSRSCNMYFNSIVDDSNNDDDVDQCSNLHTTRLNEYENNLPTTFTTDASVDNGFDNSSKNTSYYDNNETDISSKNTKNNSNKPKRHNYVNIEMKNDFTKKTIESKNNFAKYDDLQAKSHEPLPVYQQRTGLNKSPYVVETEDENHNPYQSHDFLIKTKSLSISNSKLDF